MKPSSSPSTARAVAELNRCLQELKSQETQPDRSKTEGLHMQSIQAAGHEAAIEDGVVDGTDRATKADVRPTQGLRRGKWTTEEEEYSNRLIHEFKMGTLPLTDGTTLRTFLSKLLNCDPVGILLLYV